MTRVVDVLPSGPYTTQGQAGHGASIVGSGNIFNDGSDASYAHHVQNGNPQGIVMSGPLVATEQVNPTSVRAIGWTVRAGGVSSGPSGYARLDVTISRAGPARGIQAASHWVEGFYHSEDLVTRYGNQPYTYKGVLYDYGGWGEDVWSVAEALMAGDSYCYSRLLFVSPELPCTANVYEVKWHLLAGD